MSNRQSISSRFHQRAAIVLLCAAILLVCVEAGLRWRFGLGRPLLIYLDESYGYAYRPAQDLKRFGNRVYYNHEGLRSEELQPIPGGVHERILCVGDSITNGGTVIDQNETYPYILQRQLLKSGLRVQVLNASAGGWAMENELNYLQAKGLYQSRIVILEIASHDLYQKKSTKNDVADNPNFPTTPPLSATSELLARYLLPRIVNYSKLFWREYSDPMTKAEYQECRSLLGRMVSLVRHQNAAAIVMLIPDRDEAISSSYKQDHISDLRSVCQLPSCRFIEALDRFHGPIRSGAALYRDEVHPNQAGNQVMANTALEALSAVSGIN
jgi:lysophospholipase L1-like esterase